VYAATPFFLEMELSVARQPLLKAPEIYDVDFWKHHKINSDVIKQGQTSKKKE